jgi:hypothetical protein
VTSTIFTDQLDDVVEGRRRLDGWPRLDQVEHLVQGRSGGVFDQLLQQVFLQ